MSGIYLFTMQILYINFINFNAEEILQIHRIYFFVLNETQFAFQQRFCLNKI
jgi:hypothetical protein